MRWTLILTKLIGRGMKYAQKLAKWIILYNTVFKYFFPDTFLYKLLTSARECCDDITLIVLIEEHVEYNIRTTVTFTDYKKAFNKQK